MLVAHLKHLSHSSFTHGAEPFLRSHQLCSYSRTSQHFMEPKGSLPCSQEPCLHSYIDVLLQKYERRLKDFEGIKFTVSSIHNTTSVTVQPRKLICIFSFLLSQHVLALAGHHQVLLFMLKLSNCIAYHFYLVLLYTKLHYTLIIFIKIVLFNFFLNFVLKIDFYF
jgi:hypothetical protein